MIVTEFLKKLCLFILIIVIFVSCVIPPFSFNYFSVSIFSSFIRIYKQKMHSDKQKSKFIQFFNFCVWFPFWFHSENARQVVNENAKNTTNEETKNLNHKWLSLPMHFPVHGQWWSYPLIHTQQSKQWLVVSSSTIWQREHILFLEKRCWNNRNYSFQGCLFGKWK